MVFLLMVVVISLSGFRIYHDFEEGKRDPKRATLKADKFQELLGLLRIVQEYELTKALATRTETEAILASVVSIEQQVNADLKASGVTPFDLVLADILAEKLGRHENFDLLGYFDSPCGHDVRLEVWASNWQQQTAGSYKVRLDKLYSRKMARIINALASKRMDLSIKYKAKSLSEMIDKHGREKVASIFQSEVCTRGVVTGPAGIMDRAMREAYEKALDSSPHGRASAARERRGSTD